jgi:hypothetical protein
MAEPDDAELCDLIDRYCAAFEIADMTALTMLLHANSGLEMPPPLVWRPRHRQCNPPSPSTGARRPRHGGPFRTRPQDGRHPDHPS